MILSPHFFWIGYASNFIMEGQIGLSTKQAKDYNICEFGKIL